MTNDERKLKLVLVVDTDQRFIDAVRPLLSDHRTLTAHRIDEAHEIVMGGRVDLVVLGPSHSSDASIAEAAALRTADPTASVVLCADIVTNRVLKAALRGGFADVLDLPLTAESLAAAVAAIPTAEEAREIEFLVEQPVEEPAPQYVVPSVSPQPAAPPVDSDPRVAPDEEQPHQPAFAESGSEPGPELEPYASEPSLSGEAAAWRDIAGGGERTDTASPSPVPSSPPRPSDAPAVPPADPTWWPEGTTATRPAPERSPVWPKEAADEPPAPMWRDDPAEVGHTPESTRIQEHRPEPTVEASPPLPPVEAVPPPFEPAPPRAEAPSRRPAPPPPPADAPPKPETPPPPPIPLAERDRPAPKAPSGPGRVIAVMAGKGGSGKSVVATNLAIAMGLRGDPERVAIVDADLQFGDVALMLQLDPVRTIDDVTGQLDGLTDARLDGALLRHESGLRVLPAPLLPVRSGEISAKSVVEIVDRLRSLYDTIIVDTGPVFDDGLVTILENADAVITVVDMDLPSVKNAKVALDALRRGGFPMERITLVVNRVNSKARLDLVELERSLGLRVGGSVPSDRLVPQSVNEGIPLLALSPRSKVARAFLALAERFDPAAARDRLNRSHQ